MLNVRINQCSPKLGQLEENLAAHVLAIRAASAEGVNLLVFPELSLTGYLLKDLVPDAALSRETLLESLKRETEGVRNLQAAIGFVEETASFRFYNACALVQWDSEGRISIRHVHRKVYLPTYGLFDEGRYFTAGRSIQAFDAGPLGRCGILICEDAWHLSAPLLLAMDGPGFEGAGMIIVVSNSPARGIHAGVNGAPESHRTWQSLMRAYASLLDCAVIYANRAGVEDGLSFSGGSQVIAPGGECLGGAELLQPASLDVRMDWPNLLRRARIGSRVSASENVDLMVRELQRITRNAS